MKQNKKAVFNIYQKEFTCDCCGEKSFMGIIGYSRKYPKVCDLCLVNELSSDNNTQLSSTQDFENTNTTSTESTSKK